MSANERASEREREREKRLSTGREYELVNSVYMRVCTCWNKEVDIEGVCVCVWGNITKASKLNTVHRLFFNCHTELPFTSTEARGQQSNQNALYIKITSQKSQTRAETFFTTNTMSTSHHNNQFYTCIFFERHLL